MSKEPAPIKYYDAATAMHLEAQLRASKAHSRKLVLHLLAVNNKPLMYRATLMISLLEDALKELAVIEKELDGNY